MLVLAPRAVWPQGNPLGPEFRFNTYTTNDQFDPSVTADSSGNFVVVWESGGQDGFGSGVFGQRYAGSGVPLGPEFRVNTYTMSSQGYPSVAAAASGDFVVVWSGPYGGLSDSVVGQRYASSGGPLGTEFRVNTNTTGGQFWPAVASDAAGNFVAVWGRSSPNPHLTDGVFGRHYASTGAPLGPEFRVNTYSPNAYSTRQAVASDPSGNFVVVWTKHLLVYPGDGVFAQRFAASGIPQGSEFLVNAPPTSLPGHSYPSVAADVAGNFVVVWTSYFGQDGSLTGIFGQRYGSSGAPLGPEFRVNTYTTGDQLRPSVAVESSGSFVVVWSSYEQDGSAQGVFGQRYDSGGAPLGPEFRVNTHTTLGQRAPSVAADALGNFVVVWQSQDGWGDGIFGQRYSMIVPVELMQFRVE
jgi:hypothetical protein